jgi:hypothetical protein
MLCIGWLNDNSGAVQAFLVLALVLATGYYAWKARDAAKQTERQAEASAKMAAEMRRSREDGSRPVLDIQQIQQAEFGTGPDAMLEVVAQLTHDDHVWCKLKNIGKGPALNIRASIEGDGAATQEMLGTLGVGDEAVRKPFAVITDAGSFIGVRYQDLYGRSFFSRRPVTFDMDGPHLGSLETGEEGTSDDS